MTLLALPLSRDAVTLLLKVTISQPWFALGETILTLSNHLPVFHMLQHVFQDDLLHVTGSNDEPCWSVVPRVLLIILFENVYIFKYFQISFHNIPFSSVIGGATWLPWPFKSHSACFYASWSFANTYIQKTIMTFESVGPIVFLHRLANAIFCYLYYFCYLIDNTTCEKSFYVWKEFMHLVLFIGMFIGNAAKYADTLINKATSLLHRTKQLCLQ